MARGLRGWDVRTNLNAKPGAQGTLFSGGTHEMSDRRFPRGYSPDRLHEVADAVIEPQKKFYTDGRGMVTVPGVNSTYARSFTARGDVFVDKSPIRNVVDTVARSTVPVEHLQNIQFSAYHGLVKPGATALETRDGEGAAGLYYSKHNNPAANADGRAHIKVAPAYTQDSTVIHELGHHVSHAVEHTGHAVMTRHPAGSGAEEAFADNYAEQHFRDRRGKKQRVGTYGGGQYSGNIQRPDEFWKSYHSHRDNTMYAEETARDNEDHYRRYPEDRVHSDGSSDVPLINKEFVSKNDVHPKTPELDLNWEALP